LAADDPKLKGYRGHDDLRWPKLYLVNVSRFYKDGDNDTKPAGGTRQFQYKLHAQQVGVSSSQLMWRSKGALSGRSSASNMGNIKIAFRSEMPLW
jgi:hypothetical protein